MTNQNKPSYRLSVDAGGARVTQDEGLASVVSSYLDGELSGEELVEFETLLQNNEALSREIAEMKSIDRQLTGLGADILDEPIPEALLEAFAQLEDE